MVMALGVNCGSSSLKMRLYEMSGSREDLVQKEVAVFLAERIEKGLDENPNITYTTSRGKKHELRERLSDHEQAFKIFLDQAKKYRAIKDASDIKLAGHRVVHGGRDFSEPREVTDDVLRLIQANAQYAPLHNPPNLKGIEVATEMLSGLLYQAVFCDTAFHRTMPDKAQIYFLPHSYFEDGILIYGFHGTSHEDASVRGPQIIGEEARHINQVTLHLGNGGSLCSVLMGESVDTTMGMTPLQGIPMGTRSGDIDPALIARIMKMEQFETVDQAINFLNKECGLKGVGGYSDMRDLISEAANGNEKAILARDAYAYRVAKSAYSMITPLKGKIDLLTWTGGIGEKDHLTRQRVCEYFAGLGLELNLEANAANRNIITLPGSRVKSVIVEANEERCYGRGVYLMHLDKAA